jgi:histidyl-tRNA synthetase
MDKKILDKKTIAPARLKGMKDIKGEEYYQLQGMFEKAQEIAEYYGFKPLETPTLERLDVFEKAIGDDTDIIEKEIYSFSVKGSDKLAMRPEYTAGMVRHYIEEGLASTPQPILNYAYGPVFRHENSQRGRLREFRQFNLEIMGTEKAIADAIIIRTLYDILEEFGLKDLLIDINSMGDKDSRNNYIKELTNYYKKHISSMCKDCNNRLKTNPLRLLDCKKDECQPMKEKAPQSINFLSADARKHFKELLQYLEEMEIPFRINSTLVRGLDYYSRTVFEVVQNYIDEDGNEKELTISGGGRYDLSKALGSKKDIPSVGTGIGFDRIMMMKDCIKITPKILKTPKFYFIQIGFEAKLKSLNIMEMMRKAHISVRQNLSKDSISTQLATAEDMKIPYAIIFGQKEAMEGTVIIRDMSTQSQDTIKIANLCEYLKKLK